MKLYDNYLRRIYRGGRPNWFARVQNRAGAAVMALGIWPDRAAALEVRGRRSNRALSLPVVIAEHEGDRYLVSMLGADSNWVRNVRAAGGRATLRHGRREEIRLVEVPTTSRAPILRRYLAVAPGARPHFPIDRDAPDREFQRIAKDFPVFRIVSEHRVEENDAS